MSAKPDYFRIGVFVVGGVALFITAILIFGGGQVFSPQITMETYVQGSVQGVDIGSPVKFRGVLIGKVTRINFVFTEYDINSPGGVSNYVVLFMVINREVFPDMFTEDLTPLLNQGIEQGLRVRIEPQGITGLNYLNIDYYNPGRFPPFWPTWKPHSYYIPSAPGELTSFVDSINGILREIEKMNIGSMTTSGVQLLENLNKAITGAQIDKVSSDLQTLIQEVRGALENADIPTLSADARKFLTEIESSNRNLQKILKNIEPATKLNPQQIQNLIQGLADTVSNLEQLSTEVKQRPSLLLWGKPSSTVAPKLPQKKH